MYIGVYIDDSFISTAVMNQDDEVVLIKDESHHDEKNYLIPLQLYIEDNYAYLGSQVAYLVANDHHLNYIDHFVSNLAKLEETVYTDNTGTSWNAVSLLAIFLKKMETDIQVYNEHPIQGAIVTISASKSAILTAAIQMAFSIAEIPLCGIIDMGEAALMTNQIHDLNIGNTVIQYHLEKHKLSISVLHAIEGKYDQTVSFEVNPNLGAQKVHDRLTTVLREQYERTTQKPFKETSKNKQLLNAMVEKLFQEYITNEQPYYTVVYLMDTVIECIITQPQIDHIIKAYILETIHFLKKQMTTLSMPLEAIDTILITGSAMLCTSIQKQMKPLLDIKDIMVCKYHPDQVMIKGAAQYASMLAEQDEGKSLTSVIDELNVNDIAKEYGVNIINLRAKMKAMYLNTGCEI